MISVLLRLIPYLYSFIKEMNRKDMEKGTTQKQKARYRTVIAIILSLFISYGVLTGFYIHRQLKAIKELTVEVAEEKQRGYVDMTMFVPRTDHDKVVSLMAHKMNRAEFLDELALAEIRALCEAEPYSCSPGTKRLIAMLEDFLQASSQEKGTEERIKVSLEKEKEQMREQVKK